METTPRVILAHAAAVLSVLLPGSRAVGQTPFQELVRAERDFAAASLAEGTRAAFLQVLGEDGIVFAPAPVNGREVWESRPEGGDVLSWGPAIADVSASGDFGYTSGAWSWRANADTDPSVWGHYVTVWRRGADGMWKLAADGGISHEAVPVPGGGAVARAESASSPSGSPSTARSSSSDALVAADGAFSEATTRGGFRTALEAYLAPEGRVYRNGALPFTGSAAAAQSELLAGGTGSTWELRETGVAESGEMGFTAGVVTLDPAGEGERAEMGYFRIWRTDEGGEWKVVVDLLIAP